MMQKVTMPFGQQFDSFTGLLFNTFDTISLLLELGKALCGKVKRNFPLFGRFTGTRTSL
jgi:hypothetical protein